MQQLWNIRQIFIGVLLCSSYFVNGNTAQTTASAIVISLTGFDASAVNGQAFHMYSLLSPSSESSIEIENVTSAVAFMIIQVHAQESNITLLSNNNATLDVSGYNIGLYIKASDLSSTQILVVNNNSQTVAVVVAAVAYTMKAPIPGGCNMESGLKIAPSQVLTLSDAIVKVNSPPASAPLENDKLPLCEKNFVTYQSYRLYIPQGDYSNESYFLAITKMMTVDDIINNGRKVSTEILTSPLNRTFSAYAGTGSTYAMIVTYENYSAAYVPTFSYACGHVSNPGTCYLLKTPLSKIVCATIFFVGISLTFFGYRCLPLQISLLGSISAGIIANMFLNGVGLHDSILEISLTIVIGLAFGMSCAGCWCADKPCPAILHATFTLGALIASITYLGMPDENSLFKNDASFWSIYVAICLMTVLLLCACSMSSIMICYSILGSYAIISPIDYWLGSNLKYIIINTVRRMSVPGFNVVTINPPIQTTDISLAVFWVFLALIGFYVQRRGLDGRLPFPCRGKYTTIISGGNYPHLSAERGSRRVLVLHRDDHVHQNVW